MNHDRYVLTPEKYDGVTSALIGNGELCTTVSPTGFHTPPEEQTDIAHRTQHFVLAGRRRAGAKHKLINFGWITRRILIDGHPTEPESGAQEAYTVVPGVVPEFQHELRKFGVLSLNQHRGIEEHTDCMVSLARNLIIWDTHITPISAAKHIEIIVSFHFGELDATVSVAEGLGYLTLSFQVEEHAGEIQFGSRTMDMYKADLKAVASDRGGEIRVSFPPGLEQGWAASFWLMFSDRIRFEFPVKAPSGTPGCGVLAQLSVEHSHHSQAFFDRSEVSTGNSSVDDFRDMALYTLRCQATPWSVPPTVSEEYWGAGAFHDEMYPFLGLLSSNHVELAERIPYFRLTTIPQAMQRARGRGALYPWSSTEFGEERDPNGLWLTERFHLGQFAVCIWMLWLYNRDRIQFDDLYPVLREIARYFEMNMLERDEEGRLGTKACVDFDESVGAVTNGPFTICAAIASLEYAANAAEELGRDPERLPRWRELAGELRQNLPTAKTAEGADVFGIPNGKPLHYSILGPIFPFRIEVDSARARASAEYIHKVCRSTKGWKPGFSEVFEGSNWMWTAGHLGIVHAMQGSADLAWEAIKTAPESAGPFLSPNEHVDKEGVIHVPWFTTGCGGWLYALNCLFVQVGEAGTKLLPAVPNATPNARFRDLRADCGVLISAAFRDGMLIELSARAPRLTKWTYLIPAKYGEHVRFRGIVAESENLLTISIELSAESTSLIESS